MVEYPLNDSADDTASPGPQLTSDQHIILSLNSGRITVRAEILKAGEDLCIVLSGGDRPHIGCVNPSK